MIKKFAHTAPVASKSLNLLWMGVLSLFMLGEKVAPASWRLSRGAGVLSVLWGLFLAVRLLR